MAILNLLGFCMKHIPIILYRGFNLTRSVYRYPSGNYWARGQINFNKDIYASFDEVQPYKTYDDALSNITCSLIKLIDKNILASTF